jgi:glycosyltransferase involved in cell wall biosynthesis
LKITIIQGAFLPIPPLLGGGVEKRWTRLGEEFAARGHQVAHISRTYPGLPDREEIAGVTHIRVAGYAQPQNLVRLKFLDLLYSLRAVRHVPFGTDIVVTNTFWAPLVMPAASPCAIYVDVARMPKGQMRLYARAGRLRANSAAVANAIRAELPAALHTKVSMIPNPLPFTPAELVDVRLKQTRILYCGRVHPEKGLHLLLDAVCRLSLAKRWQVDIVGPSEVAMGGGGESYLESLVKKAGASPCPIRFLGPVFKAEPLIHHYREAAIFAYPSLAESGETFGLAPLEAMSYGCVPVVSNLACFRDFITPETNGLIFNHSSPDPASDLANSLQRLIDDEPLRTTSSKSPCPDESAACEVAGRQANSEDESSIPSRMAR